MINIKMSVTVTLQGSVMMTPQECGKNPENYEHHCVVVTTKGFDKKTKKSFFKKEPIEFNTRKCKPAQQSINMCEEAYDYMTSNACPEWYVYGISNWKKLPKKQKLELHLDRLCKSLKGISYTYTVFEE